MLLDYCWKCRMKTRDVRANHLAATSSQVQLLDFSPNTNRCYVPVPGEDNDEDEEENDGQYGGCQEALLQGGQGGRAEQVCANVGVLQGRFKPAAAESGAYTTIFSKV